MAVCIKCGAQQEMYQQQSMQGAPREASGGRYTPAGYISGGYGMNSGGNDGKKSGKGLVIALIAGIVVLIAVIAVLGFMLLRGKPGGGEGNTGNTKVTREASTEATTKNTTGTTSDDGATDQSVAEVSKPYPKTTDGGFEAETAKSLYRPVLKETYEFEP